MTPEQQQIADGLWYIDRVAKTHEGVAAVLARYKALEAESTRLTASHAVNRDLLARLIAVTDARDQALAENVRLHETCDRIARAGMREVDAKNLGY
jgi:hypothetical protein